MRGRSDARGRQENLPGRRSTQQEEVATGKEAATNTKQKPEDRTEERRPTYAEQRMEKEKMKCEGENKGEDEVAAREE